MLDVNLCLFDAFYLSLEFFYLDYEFLALILVFAEEAVEYIFGNFPCDSVLVQVFDNLVKLYQSGRCILEPLLFGYLLVIYLLSFPR